MISAPGAFSRDEYTARLGRAQKKMAKHGLAALLLTQPADISYFSGFLTRFWESPTRPWFLILPESGNPVAVIPSIGHDLMARTWVTDIRCWSAPDLADDGIGLLAETMTEIAGVDAQVATPMALESHVRMPLSDWYQLKQSVPQLNFTSDNDLVADLRMIKSTAEITRIRAACNIAGHAFARVPEVAHAGVPLEQVFRQFQMLCLSEGADWQPYLAGAAGQGGYGDVISPADATPLEPGDVLMLDTGLVKGGYFCDFDRNFAVGFADDTVRSGYSRLLEASKAAFDVARPGVLASDLFYAMHKVVGGTTNAGRFGHGVGLQLTEGLSLMAQDHTVLQSGMVLALEPVIDLSNGRIMVHEENIVIHDTGADWLSPLASDEITVLDG